MVDSVWLAAVDRDVLHGGNFDDQRPGQHVKCQPPVLVGWVLGKAEPTLAVATVAEGRVVRNVPVTVCEDCDLKLRITRRLPIHCHEHVVAEYRRHGSSLRRDRQRMLAAAVIVARPQRPFVRGDKKLRTAHEAGIGCWQDYFGTPLARELASQLSAGKSRRNLPGVLALPRPPSRSLLRLRGAAHQMTQPDNYGDTPTLVHGHPAPFSGPRLA